MKLKRLMAASMAGVMAISSAIVCEITANAAETVLYEYSADSAGKITNSSFTEEAMAAVKNATSSVSVTVDAEGSGYFYLQETSNWACTTGDNPTVTISSSDEKWTDFTTANGINVNLSNYTKVNKITVTIDETDTYTIFDLSTAPKGMSFSKDGYSYPISADDLANAGVTADNIGDCKLMITFESVGSGMQLALLASSGAWENQFYWTNSLTAGKQELPLTGSADSGELGDKPLTTGILLHCKDSVISKIAISTPDANSVESVKITLKDGDDVASEYTYGLDKTISLAATVTPADADGADTVTWTSSNDKVATVDSSGVVTLLKAGDVTITAEAGGKSGTVTFTVAKWKVGASFLPSAPECDGTEDVETLVKEEINNLKISFWGSGSSVVEVPLVKDQDYTVTYKLSADKKSYTVTVALIGDAAGKYELRDDDTYSTTKTCGIAYVLRSVALNHDTLSLFVGGDGRQLTATTAPDNALLDNLKFSYSSSDPAVASVDENGNVTPLKAGTATIKVVATADVMADGIIYSTRKASAECKVTVTDNAIPATSIELDADNKTMKVGDKAKLTATVKPADTTDKVTWKSSNEKVATVDADGNITALSAGTAEITATAGSVSAACKVTVKAPQIIQDNTKYSSIPKDYAKVDPVVTTVNSDGTKDMLILYSISDSDVENYRAARVYIKKADGTSFDQHFFITKFFTDVTYLKDGDTYVAKGQNYIAIRLRNVQDSWGDISIKLELINGLG